MSSMKLFALAVSVALIGTSALALDVKDDASGNSVKMEGGKMVVTEGGRTVTIDNGVNISKNGRTVVNVGKNGNSFGVTTTIDPNKTDEESDD